jgi:CRP-like cAMP-binding protein
MQIKDLSIFHNLDDTEFKKSLVCTQSVIHEYKKNDYIFFQGDVPNKLYLILNGEVELGSINVNGKVLRITNISEGEDFGGICFEMNDCDIEVTNTSEEKIFISLQAQNQMYSFAMSALLSLYFKTFIYK